MGYEIEPNYNQQWLLPPSLEELLPASHPARLVREFIDAVDLEKMGFQVRKAETGRPHYAVHVLTKVIVYGYMNKVRSTRGWEKACLNDIGMLWLTGMNYPDHTTLWRCWNDNRQGLRKLFKQLLQVAMAANLVGLVMHAVDGTKILSAASEGNGWHRVKLQEKLKRLERAIDEIMKQTEQAGVEGGECRLPEQFQQRDQLRQMIQQQLRELDAAEREHLNPQDRDARVMKCGALNQFAYNAQAVVDQQGQLIVGADVVTDESDNYQLVPMLEQVKENLGEVADQTVADAGYKATTQLGKAEQNNYSVMVNLHEPTAEEQPYHASRFVYDATKDECICPRGEVLGFERTKLRDKVEPYTVRVYRCSSFESCPVRWQCSSSVEGRTVQIHPDHAALVHQREKQRDEAMRQLLRQRGATVEPVFGWIKEAMGFRRWSFRGLEKTQTQWSVICMAVNLRRLYKHWAEGNLRFA
jgi:transposase